MLRIWAVSSTPQPHRSCGPALPEEAAPTLCAHAGARGQLVCGADYYTNFSLVLNLANEAEKTYALDLAHKASLAQQGDELPADFPKALVEMIEDWQFETVADDSGTKHGLWLHSGYGGVDAVCAFIQHLLQKFDPKSYVTFEWSHDCPKPRVDAYGGGAAVITAQEIRTMSTAAWLNEQIA